MFQVYGLSAVLSLYPFTLAATTEVLIAALYRCPQMTSRVGTPAYMAPELATDGYLKDDEDADDADGEKGNRKGASIDV